jgi:hypothetical protein
VDNPDTIERSQGAPASRRGLLSALGLGGLAASALATASRADAQASSTTTAAADTTPTTEAMMTAAAPTTQAAATASTEAAVTTTTAPPQKPQPTDLPLLAAAKVLELTATALYATANGRASELGLDEPTTALMAALQAHHQAYAEAISAMYGPGSPSSENAELATLLGAPDFGTGDAAAVRKAAIALETAASDTHLSLLGALDSTDAASLVASIEIMESRHAATLSHLDGVAYDATKAAIDDAGAALTAAQITGGN